MTVIGRRGDTNLLIEHSAIETDPLEIICANVMMLIIITKSTKFMKA